MLELVVSLEYIRAVRYHLFVMIKNLLYSLIGGSILAWAGAFILQSFLPNPNAPIAQAVWVPLGIIGIALGILFGNFLERKFSKNQPPKLKEQKFIYSFLWGGIILLIIFIVGFYFQIQLGF